MKLFERIKALVTGRTAETPAQQEARELEEASPATITEVSYYNAWEHQGWGNRIGSPRDNRMDGHLGYDKPETGDIIRYIGEAGKVMEYRVTGYKYCRDPNDMFFATLELVGYPLEEMMCPECGIGQQVRFIGRTAENEYYYKCIECKEEFFNTLTETDVETMTVCEKVDFKEERPRRAGFGHIFVR